MLKNPWWKLLVVILLLISLWRVNIGRAGTNLQNKYLINYMPIVFHNYPLLPDMISFIRIDPNDISKQILYLVNGDGSGLLNLTTDPTSIYYNRWSPDGMKIAFEAYWNNNLEIYVINSDGSGLINLTNNPAMDFDPTWSNNSSQIAFISNREGSSQVYVMNADGSNVTKLTNLTPGTTIPIWSPIGNKIAFDVFGNGYDDEEIYVINSDGSGLVRLSDNAYFDNVQGWSPDGTKILFRSDRDLITSEDLYAINPDGTGVVRLTTIGGVVAAEWSPNSHKIAVATSLYGLYVMNSDGSNHIPMVCQSEVVNSYDINWSPDSTRIAYSPINWEFGVTSGIYAINIDGSGCQHLTSMRDANPRWKPHFVP